MDETTHPFSKKRIDRANTIEFNYINLEQFPEGLTTEITPERVSTDSCQSEYLQLIDAYDSNQQLVQRVTTKLVKVNDILEQIPFARRLPNQRHRLFLYDL